MMRRRWQQAGMIIAASALIGTALGFGLWILYPELRIGIRAPNHTESPAGQSGDESLDQAQKLPEEEAIVRIQRVFHYMGCGHTITRWEDSSEGEEIPDLETIRRENPGCSVEAFPSHIRIDEWIYQYCPEHFVLFPDGEHRLAIYKNIDGGDRLSLWKEFEMELCLLTEDVYDSLAWGRAFDSLEDIEHFIEDVSS